MIRLGVNIDHVATLRQARRAKEPDPVAAAVLAQLGGADGITIHLREDRRHIQDRDVRLLRQTVTRILNLEMAVADEIVAIACEVKPDQVTLVPERRQELTTEGGLDVVGNRKSVKAAIAKLADSGIPTSLFIGADRKQVEMSREVGAVAIELHTGAYADAPRVEERRRHLGLLRDAAEHARQIGLNVHMGHGLDTINVVDIARIPGVEELNIGFSIITRAVFLGLERAVREMKETIDRAR